jgi:sialate O-acetylesterase
MDVGSATNLHPFNKKPIGLRLAKTALNQVYGRMNMQYQGPAYRYMEIRKKTAVIHFDPATLETGLQTNDGKAPAFFSIAGEDQVFYPASATIVNNTILVTSGKVKKPVAVRYAFTNYAVTNLENKNGIPAVQFRTDNWAEPATK